MPKVIVVSHAYNCKACQWRTQGDKRTLSHAVKLHNRLVHKVKTGDLGMKDTDIVPKKKYPTQLYHIDTVYVPEGKKL
jgi:hypothetical protein